MGKDGAGASRDQFVIGYCRGSSAHGSGPRTSPKFQMSVASCVLGGRCHLGRGEVGPVAGAWRGPARRRRRRTALLAVSLRSARASTLLNTLYQFLIQRTL